MSERKWVTEVDEYVCKLSPETQQIAKEELREDKVTRDAALQALREWVISNPKIINSRLDSKFLLRFLRFKKYSVVEAQEALQRYILLRQTFGIAFNNLDITIPMMQDLTELGYMFASPKRDKMGRRVVIVRPGVFDLDQFMNGDMCRIHGIVWETLMEDEENQIRGFTHFVDGKGVGFAYLTLFTIKEAVRIVKNGEKTLPMRHKEVYVINVNPSMKFAVDFGLSLISEKIRKRFNFYRNLEDCLKDNKIDREVLPEEYGGTIPMTKMIELWKDELQKSHKTLMSHDEMAVNENMFSSQAKEGAVSALRKNHTSCGGEDDFVYGVSGSFRKLEVD